MNKLNVVAINFPSWHPHDHMDCWKGEGWTEYELLKTAPARFSGHQQPKVPEWGYYDESDPQWQTKEIDLAADHGIGVMLFDWYWYSGVQIMQETLERGFLQAPNRNRLKFALMWANHTWADYFPAPFGKPWNLWLPMRHTLQDMERMIDYCIEHYFSQDNYWRVDGRIFLSIYNPTDIIGQLGGPAAFRKVAANLDGRLARAGLPPLYWQAMTYQAAPVATFQEAGFHSTTSYNAASSGKVRPDFTEDYSDVIDAHTDRWRQMCQTPLPYDPIVTVGWDATPRCEHGLPWPYPPQPEAADAFGGTGPHKYPYGPVVVGNTPERFARLCGLAREHAIAHPTPAHAVFINAWNEWTEGCYLLPEKRTGLAYLQAVRAVFSPGNRAWRFLHEMA